MFEGPRLRGLVVLAHVDVLDEGLLAYLGQLDVLVL